MPSKEVILDNTGQGWVRFDRPPSMLTIINPTANSVNFRWKEGSVSIPLLANTQVEFEESEASEVLQLYFDSGLANGVLKITWSTMPETVRLG